MSEPCTIVCNGRRISVRRGESLLDAAMDAGIVIPHDCATGQCNTCRVRIYEGEVDPCGTAVNDTVLACQATVTGPAVVEFDDVPPVVARHGTVVSLEDLTPDVIQVTVALPKRLTYLPGQYVKVAFAGLPGRDYSPTLKLDGSGDLNELVFHIRRERGGTVSGEFGRRIRAGSPLRVRGPFGTAFHRLGQGRLVLVSSGVGWAPVWAVARACSLREPAREMVIVAGARSAANLYMRPCLDWLAERGATTRLTCSAEGAALPADVRAGRPTLHLPRLAPSDTIVAAGLPGMVAAVEFLAATGGATCYADPFLPARTPPRLRDRLFSGLLSRIAGTRAA